MGWPSMTESISRLRTRPRECKSSRSKSSEPPQAQTCALAFLQSRESRQHLLAVRGRVNLLEHFRNLAARIDDERVAGRVLRAVVLHRRTILLRDLALGV